MTTLDQRDLQPELMDDAELPADSHRDALDALGRINRASAVSRQLWTMLRPLAPARVLDLGCGGGDVTRALALRASREGIDLQFHGLDMSARAVDHARAAAASAHAPVTYDTLHVPADSLPTDYEVVMCTLFLHHLDDEQAVELLRSMARAARRLVLVADLARSRAGLALAWAGTRLLTRCPVVHDDGVQSVRAAFTPAEALALARRAGLDAPSIRSVWPCRWMLTSRTS